MWRLYQWSIIDVRLILAKSIIPASGRWLVKGYLCCVEHHLKAICDSSLKQPPFGWEKDALPTGANSMIIWLTGEEFYSWYICWSIIGGVCYIFHYWCTRGEAICSFIFVICCGHKNCQICSTYNVSDSKCKHLLNLTIKLVLRIDMHGLQAS